jgi:peptidoglycan/xylan/chitin deacetylase (PgdA/CDA1 family)
MRPLHLVLIAGSLAAAAATTATVMHFTGKGGVKSDASAAPDVVTGTISARWPKADSSGSVAPAPQAVNSRPADAALPAPERRPAPAKAACANPNALGVARTVQIDTTGGPGLGMSQYRDYDFLQPGEVVLTFDDGPWPNTTPAVLAALAAQCTQAVFFPIGKHATWHPEVLKQVIAAGQTVGSHTWSHKNLASRSEQEAEDEIERGVSAVSLMAGSPIAPFFRFPQLRQTPGLKAYLGQRNIAAFSIDIDSEDFRIHKPDVLVTTLMEKLKKKGKGIVLMHDLHRWTATAVPTFLEQLKAGGYKVVNIKAKDTLATLPQYDKMISDEMAPKTASSNGRPMSSVVQNVD